ncbi:MAG: hypothetical protein ABEL51_02165 [Salinibacter sp.]
MISRLGANTGDTIDGDSWNERGYWEHGWGHRINGQILEYSDGAWDSPPSSVRVSWRIRLRMCRFLGRLHAEGRTTVWKDPRNILTLPVWRPVIVNYVPVAVFRHPMSVAQSLQKRNGFPIERGIRLWTDYNERLIDIADQEDEMLFLDFDGGISHIRSRLRLLAQHVPELQYEPDAVDPYDEGLRTSDNRTSVPNKAVQRTYDAIRERATSQKAYAQ